MSAPTPPLPTVARMVERGRALRALEAAGVGPTALTALIDFDRLVRRGVAQATDHPGRGPGPEVRTRDSSSSTTRDDAEDGGDHEREGGRGR